MDKKSPASSALADAEARKAARVPYMQNRELSWLTFDQRCLDQGRDETVPLLERLQFVSIFTSNLQEFFMVRVGSLTDLELLKQPIIDTKSNMTPAEQLDAIYARCHELYPLQEQIYHEIDEQLAAEGIHHLQYDDLDENQRDYVSDVLATSALPYLSPQIINARHPFPHLENGSIYIIVRLIDEDPNALADMTKAEKKAAKEERKRLKNQGAEGVTLGIVPLPRQAPRVIKVPGEGFNYILLEDALEASAKRIFSMYTVKHSNIVCVTRNADLDSTETADEGEEDYREHMKKILKKRARLAPVRLESKNKLSPTVSEFLLARLKLEPYQVYTTTVPFDMGFAFALPGMVDGDVRAKLTSKPFAPAWAGQLRRDAPILKQIQEREALLSYPYESMDPFVQLLREAAADPYVVSIKITLYRLASQSHLAEALIAAAEAGKDVTALFELRARFDESNNIQWSQRFEEAGCNVIYGFHDYKVHSKICYITRRTPEGLQHITQLGTGNYNEKTAKLYTDFSFITTDPAIGRDAVEFFRNMGLENASSDYKTLWVAPLQIKQNIIAGIQGQIDLAKEGKPCGLFFKTNSVTDKDIINKIAEASQANVPVTLLVRGISCLIPQVGGYTDNVRVVSIVGRLLEHSRIYGFGAREDMRLYLASADLMTRNMDKRVEIAWPVTGEEPRQRVLDYIDACLRDNVKLRELLPDGTYTPLRALKKDGDEAFNAQEHLIVQAAEESAAAREIELSEKTAYEKLSFHAREKERDQARAREAQSDLEAIYAEALNHDMNTEEEAYEPYIRAAMKAITDTVGLEDAAKMAPAIAAALAAAMPVAVAATKRPAHARAEVGDIEHAVMSAPAPIPAPAVPAHAKAESIKPAPDELAEDFEDADAELEATPAENAVETRKGDAAAPRAEKADPAAEGAPGEPEAAAEAPVEPEPATTPQADAPTGKAAVAQPEAREGAASEEAAATRPEAAVDAPAAQEAPGAPAPEEPAPGEKGRGIGGFFARLFRSDK